MEDKTVSDDVINTVEELTDEGCPKKKKKKESVEEVNITPGMANAMHGGPSCPHCQKGIPKYRGRYPNTCPHCGEDRRVE